MALLKRNDVRRPRLHLAGVLALLLLATGACQCGGGGAPDGGTADAADAGGPDAGPKDGGPDAGLKDGGDDGGPDAGDGGMAVDFRIDEVVPVRGPAAGGTRVTLRGRGFVEPFAKVGDDVDGKTAILFGANTAIEFTVIDDDTIEVVTPPGVVGARDVRVQNPNGEAVCTGCFTYYTPVEASSLSPDAAPLDGGVTVTVTGDGFTEDTLVLLGGRAGIDVTLLDAQTLTFVAPPHPQPETVDLLLFNSNGEARLRRRFTYYAAPRLDRVDPPVGDAAGGQIVTLRGEGLAGATEVRFGGAPATNLASSGPDALVAIVPPGTPGTVVDVSVVHPRGTTTLPRGFAYVDPDLRDVTLLSVSPARGPTDGGTEVILVGTGLDHPGLQVRFGETDLSGAVVVDAHQVRVQSPPAASAGSVDVQVRNVRGGARLPAAFTYYEPIQVAGVDPASGPAAGGTAITVTGSGFAPGVEVRVGALPATDVTVVDPATLTAVTPPGSPGPADVVVGTGSGVERVEGRGRGAFVYVDELALAQVEPARGAQAGGTYVVLKGSGFGDDAIVRFGGAAATVVQRTGQNLLAVRTPPGSPGLVDVEVESGGSTAVLPKAFQYYDPTNVRGGASGGPMAGTINITLLDAIVGIPVDGATVVLGDGSVFSGQTNERGQVTFSDPSLVKPVDVSAFKAGYEAVTVSRIDARDLTLYLTPNEGEPGPPPVFPPPAFVGGSGPGGSLGTVCGFKLPPGIELGPNQVEEARVFVTTPSVTRLPPFGSPPFYQVVSEDCGTFILPSRPGNVAVYAFYGIKTTTTDATGQAVETFEPILMGITRGIEVPAIDPPICTPNRACPGGFECQKGPSDWDPENPNDFAYCLCTVDAACDAGEICNQAGGCQPPLRGDVVLSMHMDLSVPIRLVNPPQPDLGPVHLTYSYLELGGEGAAYIGQVQNTTNTFLFERHPRLPGDGFVFLNMTTNGGSYPLSLYYRRQIGDLEQGVDIGPMQPMTRLISPVPGGALTGGRVQWAYDGTPVPDVVLIFIDEPGFVPKPLWQIILPGTETQVDVPPAVLEVLRQSPALSLTLITALSARFDFDHFSYGQLGLGAWNSFTLDSQSFVVP